MDVSDDPEQILRILLGCRTIAAVGCSPRRGRDGYGVVRYLIGKGYEVVLVNPGVSRILGRRCYPNLGSVPRRIHVVGVFGSPACIPAVAEEAIAAGAECLWLQEGLAHEAAARRAAEAGLYVVQDRCLKKLHARLVARTAPG